MRGIPPPWVPSPGVDRSSGRYRAVETIAGQIGDGFDGVRWFSNGLSLLSGADVHPTVRFGRQAGVERFPRGGCVTHSGSERCLFGSRPQFLQLFHRNHTIFDSNPDHILQNQERKSGIFSELSPIDWRVGHIVGFTKCYWSAQ
jgi:hypothetical protein